MRQSTCSSRVRQTGALGHGRRVLHVAGEKDDGAAPSHGVLVGTSRAIRDVEARLRRLAATSCPVLVTGESGTGKELAAKMLHAFSGRVGPFVPFNCGGAVSTMIHDQLFGHEKGAFTGALDQHKGVFERAAGGTVFLDEIGELPLEQQAVLLRVLEDRVVYRLGSERPTAVSFRLVAATNRDLRALVNQGRFRQDLYFRIAGATVTMPPLREHPEDIPALVRRFLGEIEAELGPIAVSASALQRLRVYGWPGNCRELRNVLWRAAVAATNGRISVRHIEFDFDCPNSLPGASDEELVAAYFAARCNISLAAKNLRMPRTTYRNRLIRLVPEVASRTAEADRPS